MTTVFVGGSRRIARIDAGIMQRLDRMVERRLRVMVGDANGADSAVQDYLHERRYDLVEVFCSGSLCRNNRGGWPTRTVTVPAATRRRDFSFYAAKDREMAVEATVGLMLWDGESFGTVMNVQRLIGQHKMVVVYVQHKRQFVDVKSSDDWDRFLAMCNDTIKDRLSRTALAERGAGTRDVSTLPL
jgi:hypothetical protein